MTTIRHRSLIRLQQALRPVDLWIGRRSYTPEARRAMLLRKAEVDWVIDVGAHTGESVAAILAEGWKGRIDSFEPDPRSIDRLRTRAAKVDGWNVHATAVGDRTGVTTLHLAGNEVSSSTLPMGDLHVLASPESTVGGTVEVAISRLDDAIDVDRISRVFLKIDVQGGENQVIAGAQEILTQVELLQLEMSIRPLYEGQTSWRELMDNIEGVGFYLASIVPGFTDPRSGEMLQFDGIFRRCHA